MTNGAIPFFLDDADLFEGIALCLSGGGYRAMLFHAGAIWRLNELRLLRKVNLVSSVSGGSIAAGALAVAWPNLDWDKQDDTASATNLSATFIAPIVQQAQDAIAKNLPPGKAGLQVGTLRLDGIVRAPSGMIAVVANPQNRTYFLREGDQLYDGKVEKISMEGVTFHEEGKDAFGKPVERQVNKRLYSSAGEQQ